MNSSISHFRPWLVAALALLAIEIFVWAVWRPHPVDRTNFLRFAFARGEPPQRAFVYHKIKAFVDSNPAIVQSGDSSGLYGIEPRKVMEHLPPGMTFLNMSCCANLGYNGYYNLLELMLKRNDGIRYALLHVTPYTMPRPETWNGGDGAALWGTRDIQVFGDAIRDEFDGPRRLTQLPSLGLRREVTNFVYYLGSEPDRPLIRNVDYDRFLADFRQNFGWVPETDKRVSVPASECQVPMYATFDWRTMSRKPILEEVMESFARLARSYGVTLVVVFQPVACVLGSGAGTAEARAAIERFQRHNPDVEIPFPLVESWDSDLFSVPAHVKSEHTDLIGDRLGRALAEIIARREG